MHVFSSILVPLDGSHTAARSLGCATWLAARLGARLHILSAREGEIPARDELARLKVPEEVWPLVVLHQAPAYPEEAILAAIAQHDVQLVVMTARGEAADDRPADESAELEPARIVGHVTRGVIEGSQVPVLLLPPAYREALPWERVLVPVSGEVEADEALALAVRLAHALDLAVHVAHVVAPDAGEESLAARARYADALHHEYPRQLEGLVRRVLPWAAPEERRRIESIALCHGDVTAELAKLVEEQRMSLVVVGWHGRFMTGRARVLKRLIQVITRPLLLVRAAARMPSRLEVGEEIE